MQARDFCILFRRFLSFGEDVTQPYARALEARGVPHVLVGGKTFHNREEIETLRAALSAIEWPDDELSVFATLRGALFAIGDEELLEWKQRVAAPCIPSGPEQATSDRRSSPAHRRRAGGPAAAASPPQLPAGGRNGPASCSRRRARTSAWSCAAAASRRWPTCSTSPSWRASTEAAGGLSFRGFVDELRVAAEDAQAAEAPILEEASDGVRMMTVHKAKGLEFPIVILADVTCKLARADAGRWLDPEHNLCALKIGGWSPIDLILHDAEESARDKAESQRLTYVAATRAKDVLVVPAIGDGPYDGGWLDPIMPAIYPPDAQRRSPEPARGVPLFKSKDTVLVRPDGDPASSRTVAPGTFVFSPDLRPPTSDLSASAAERLRRGLAEARQQHHAGEGGPYAVTWWDPRSLRLGAESTFGLRRDDLIVKDGDMFAVEDRLADYEKWHAARSRTITAASQPTIRFMTATAWAAEAARLGVDEAILSVPAEGGNYTGREAQVVPSDPAVSAASPPGPVVSALRRNDIQIVEIVGAENRPRGPRFGTLVHAVLATVALDASDEVIERTAATHGRLLSEVTPDEVRAAVTVVSAVLRHELIARARASASIKRETPVSWVQKDGMLIEGVLDLAFDEGEETVVVDFKTDHELAAGETRYRAQLLQYVNAVSRATGRPASGVLFRV